MRFDYYLLVISTSHEIKGKFDTLGEALTAAWMFGEDTYYVLGYLKTRGHVMAMDEEAMKKVFEEDF